MKHTLIALTLLLSACMAPLESRMAANPGMFEKLSASHQTLVRQRRVVEGMSRDAVYLAWGRPARIQKGRRNGKELERWSYNVYEPVYYSSFSFGAYYGGGCGHADPFFFGGPSVDYVPMEGRSVEFTDGKVTGFTLPH